MSQASDLLRRGQSFQATQFPATIKIGIQSYAASVTGLRRSQLMDERTGGVKAVRRISFWLPITAFQAAGAEPPVSGDSLECVAPETHRGRFTISSVNPDAASQNFTLICEAQAQ